MDVKEANQVAKDINEYETLRDDTMYAGEGKLWISWLIYRLYEHGYVIVYKDKG